MMRMLLFILPLLLTGCLRNSSPTRQEEDKTIIMPDFYERFPDVVGRKGSLYELDGISLKALKVASDDFLPPEARARSCWDTQEAHVYRVIRQADIIFVRIDANPDACGRGLILFDSGVEYAISVDGRILRRRFDGEPNGPLGQGAPDAGTQEPAGEPVPYSSIGVGRGEPVGPLPAFLRRDGGAGLDGGPQEDGGLGDSGVPAEPSK
jgi:hypothetical protein